MLFKVGTECFLSMDHPLFAVSEWQPWIIIYKQLLYLMSLMAHNLLNCTHLAVELAHVSMKLRISFFAYDAYSEMYWSRIYRKSSHYLTHFVSLVQCQSVDHTSEGVLLLWCRVHYFYLQPCFTCFFFLFQEGNSFKKTTCSRWVSHAVRLMRSNVKSVRFT